MLDAAFMASGVANWASLPLRNGMISLLVEGFNQQGIEALGRAMTFVREAREYSDVAAGER
jgi:hypothetical protein